ncbi:hypothetical protein LCGC14_2860290 [marine sediment metagenome]|uniref:Uncharacterized protein n=1 Tax=marine sediment metagenome TaxID=412755 RepID=A0A0F8YSJ1_9ZZZZ
MYKPEGWKNPFDECVPLDLSDKMARDAYESGADAMLEGLVKSSRRVDINEYGGVNCYFPYLLTIPAKGYLVFIPEEE